MSQLSLVRTLPSNTQKWLQRIDRSLPRAYFGAQQSLSRDLGLTCSNKILFTLLSRVKKPKVKGSPVLCSLCFSLGNTKPALVLGVSEGTNQRFDPPTLYQSPEVWTSLYEYELAASSIPPAPAFPRAAMQTGRYFKRNKKELTSGLRAAECCSKMSVPWPSPFLSRDYFCNIFNTSALQFIRSLLLSVLLRLESRQHAQHFAHLGRTFAHSYSTALYCASVFVAPFWPTHFFGLWSGCCWVPAQLSYGLVIWFTFRQKGW